MTLDFIDTNVLLYAFSKKALSLCRQLSLSYYDALIIATALQNNCKKLFSEDMQHNQIIEGNLTIINPFIK